jgi:hypothetical protein
MLPRCPWSLDRCLQRVSLRCPLSAGRAAGVRPEPHPFGSTNRYENCVVTRWRASECKLKRGVVSGAWLALAPYSGHRDPAADIHDLVAYGCLGVFIGMMVLMLAGPLTDGPLALVDDKTVAELLERVERVEQAGNTELVPAGSPQGRGSEPGPAPAGEFGLIGQRRLAALGYSREGRPRVKCRMPCTLCEIVGAILWLALVAAIALAWSAVLAWPGMHRWASLILCWPLTLASVSLLCWVAPRVRRRVTPRDRRRRAGAETDKPGQVAGPGAARPIAGTRRSRRYRTTTSGTLPGKR